MNHEHVKTVLGRKPCHICDEPICDPDDLDGLFIPQDAAKQPDPGEYGYEGSCDEHGDACDNDHDA